MSAVARKHHEMSVQQKANDGKFVTEAETLPPTAPQEEGGPNGQPRAGTSGGAQGGHSGLSYSGLPGYWTCDPRRKMLSLLCGWSSPDGRSRAELGRPLSVRGKDRPGRGDRAPPRPSPLRGRRDRRTRGMQPC